MYPDIHLLIPHADTMVLLDRVIAADEESLCAEVMISPHSLFYEVIEKNSGNTEGVGAWVGIEYMAQTIAAYAGYQGLMKGGQPKIGFLVGTRHYQCSTAVFEKNSLLKIQVKCILQAENGLHAFECKISRCDREIASAIMNAFLPDNVEEFLEETTNERNDQ